MEKPSSNRYESSSRLLYTSKEDTEQKERFYDRMTIRGIPVLRDTDSAEQVPAWRGDHTFSSDAASYSLTHFIEPEIAREHPTWSQQQITEAATHRFEQRLSQDLSYEHKESAHEESVVHWQPIQNKEGTWELATKYGDTMVTLPELWEHTREYAEFAGNPDAYNPEEHRAQLRMQEELIRGEANGFVSVLSHPDAIRYVQVWQKTDDGSIISKQVDLYKTTGRDFSHEEGAKLIDHLAAYFKEDVGGGEASVISYAHIYIHEKEVAEEDIRTIAIAQAMETHDVSAPSFERSIPTTVLRIGSTAVRDTTESMVQLGAFLREHIDRKIHALKDASPEGKKSSSEQASIHTAEVVAVRSDVKKGDSTISRVLPDLHRKTEHDTIPHTTDVMKTIVSEWLIARTMLAHKDASPVVPFAFILLLTRPLTSESTNTRTSSDQALEHVQEDVIPERQTKMQRLGESLRNAFSFIWKDREKKKIRTSIRAKDVQVNILHKQNSRKEHTEHTHLPTHKETPIHALSLSTVISLLRILHNMPMFERRISKSGKRIENSDSTYTGSVIGPNTHRSEKFTSVHSKSHEYAVKKFTAAIIVWWLTEYSRHTFNKPFDIEGGDSGTDKRDSMIDQQESVPSSWILFSIIWYLTALREHGKQGSMNTPPVSKKQSKKSAVKQVNFLPSSGIIFTFGS